MRVSFANEYWFVAHAIAERQRSQREARYLDGVLGVQKESTKKELPAAFAKGKTRSYPIRAKTRPQRGVGLE
jgi:hypothetical protein